MRVFQHLAESITGVSEVWDTQTGNLLRETYNGPIGLRFTSEDEVLKTQDRFAKVFGTSISNQDALDILRGNAWGEEFKDKHGKLVEVVFRFVHTPDDIAAARVRIGELIAARQKEERPIDPI